MVWKLIIIIFPFIIVYNWLFNCSNKYLLNFTVDVTVCHRGYHGDLNETFLVGNVSKTAEKLVNVTWECLEKAINAGKLIIYFLNIRFRFALD